MNAAGPPVRVLLVSPRFNGESFWAYKATSRLAGARYPAPSLGLITVAALLPQHWPMRLFDRNVIEDEAAFDAALAAADLVLAGGMLPQQTDLFDLIRRARAAGKPILVGGPDVSSSPHLYAAADFRVIGEAEGCMAEFVAAWHAGARSGEFSAAMGSVDVATSPTPRFDLLDLSAYTEITVQFSRGCPFLCEFCDIIELYGRKPRTKGTAQMLQELDALHALGWRGLVEFSDDNLIGNKKAVKAFLPALIEWQRARGYPFELATEASLNLADDPELLALLREANFIAVGIGIESPDSAVLTQAQKKQNARRDIADSVHRIQAAGIVVAAGFILGFDNEAEDAADTMVSLIEAAAIPIAMVGLLVALPNTQLTRRLAREGRLHEGYDLAPGGTRADQCISGLNFETTRPRRAVLSDYREVVARIYAPDAYFARIRRAVRWLECSGVNGQLHPAGRGRSMRLMLRFMVTVTLRDRVLSRHIWPLLAHVLLHNPRAVRHALYAAALYAHFGPFSRRILAEMDREIALAEPLPRLAAE